MGKVWMAPEETELGENLTLFLAGSIDMGKAVNWQDQIIKGLKDLPVDIYNPRRDDWDSTWEQNITNKKFREQVEWELDHLKWADMICYYFDPKGQAPITLLELGLFHDKDIVVCCPDGFWRKGNVDVVCNYFGIPVVQDIEQMIAWLWHRIIVND